MTASVTRRRLTWNSLTERTPWASGDVVDVWDCETDQQFRGVYTGLAYGINGRIVVEVESLDDPDVSQCYDILHPVALRLVSESRPLPGPEPEPKALPVARRVPDYAPVCPPGYEPLSHAIERERREARYDDKPLPLSSSEARWVTLAIIGGCIFWGCIILYAIGR